MAKKFWAAVAVLFVAVVFASAASANRNHGASVSVSPSAPHVNDALTFSGCGYQPGGLVGLVVTSPYAISFTGMEVGSDGCFSSSNWGYSALEAGSYTVKTYQSNNNHADASLTFSVSS